LGTIGTGRGCIGGKYWGDTLNTAGVIGDSMGDIWTSVSSLEGGIDTTFSCACLLAYFSAIPIISKPAELTDETMFAAAEIWLDTAPITGTMLKTAAVSLTVFAMLVMPFRMGLSTFDPNATAFVAILAVTDQNE
jgi:hypothetical protein